MFSERLRKLREEKKISQLELAKFLNISQQALSKWEQNISQPDNNVLIILSNYFDVSVDYLLGKSDNKNPSNGLYTKTITDEDGYSIEIKTEVPFNELSKEKQQDMIDVAMEKLFEVKKEIKEKK
jgi:transcriptional regulator with XRE-family HTH domain|nr:MAG TPA: Repressor protein CI [Caudoviricetes sp.]